MIETIQLRRDTAANWVSVNPVLAQGEAGVETDTRKAKLGDGATAWTGLPYWNPGGAAGGALPESGGTMTGWLAPAVTSLTFGSSIAVNAQLGNAFNLTLTASSGTLASPSSPVDGQVIRIRVTQGTGGSFTLAYGSAYDFGAAGTPTLSTAAGKVDILGFEYVASISKWTFLGSGLGF